MTQVHSGGCQCGAIRYEIEGEPLKVYACHCTICQRQSGSAFGMAVLFDRRAMRMTGVAPAHFLRPGCHVWTRNAQPWIRFAADDVVFEGQPSFDEMPGFAAA